MKKTSGITRIAAFLLVLICAAVACSCSTAETIVDQLVSKSLHPAEVIPGPVYVVDGNPEFQNNSKILTVSPSMKKAVLKANKQLYLSFGGEIRLFTEDAGRSGIQTNLKMLYGSFVPQNALPVWSPDSRYVFMGDSMVYLLFDTETCTCWQYHEAREYFVYAAAFSPDSRYLYVIYGGNEDKTLKVLRYDIESNASRTYGLAVVSSSGEPVQMECSDRIMAFPFSTVPAYMTDEFTLRSTIPIAGIEFGMLTLHFSEDSDTAQGTFVQDLGSVNYEFCDYSPQAHTFITYTPSMKRTTPIIHAFSTTEEPILYDLIEYYLHFSNLMGFTAERRSHDDILNIYRKDITMLDFVSYAGIALSPDGSCVALPITSDDEGRYLLLVPLIPPKNKMMDDPGMYRVDFDEIFQRTTSEKINKALLVWNDDNTLMMRFDGNMAFLEFYSK